MRDAVIVEAVRTPVGRRNGGLSGVHPADLSAHVLRSIVQRTGIDPALVDDVVWGCVSQVGEQTFDIGRTAVLAAGAPDPLVTASADVLPRLRDRTGESVQVYRTDGLSRICIAVAEPVAGLRDTVPLGARLPMNAGSGAKVLVAWADPATQRALLVDATFTERILAEVRRRGWAQSVAEREAGVASVSAPVRDPRGSVIAAVSVSGPVERIGRRPGARWAGDLVEAADALTARL